MTSSSYTTLFCLKYMAKIRPRANFLSYFWKYAIMKSDLFQFSITSEWILLSFSSQLSLIQLKIVLPTRYNKSGFDRITAWPKLGLAPILPLIYWNPPLWNWPIGTHGRSPMVFFFFLPKDPNIPWNLIYYDSFFFPGNFLRWAL